MNKYCILLSTYKNHEFLNDLIDSFDMQTETDWIVYWREDSSLENKILEERGNKYIKCSEIKGSIENLGVKKSFIKLLSSAPLSKYYIFCDQDDVWNSKRLEQANEKIKYSNDKPMLLIQNGVRYTNGKEGVKLIPEKIQIKENIIFDNPFPGCCMVINEAGRRLFLNDKEILRKDRILHDWLLINVAYANKWDIIFDQRSAFKYRIHSNNTIGLPGPIKKIKTLIEKKNIIDYIYSHAEILKNNLKYYKSKTNRKDKILIKIIAINAFLKLDLIKAIILIPFIFIS